MDRRAVERVVEESLELKRRFIAAEADRVLEAGRLMARALARGGKILAFGNGGSAADAQHFASELVNRFVRERPALAAVALTTDASVLTSIANDYDYRIVFRRQVEALGREGDVGLAISTSGESPNVLEAVAACRERGLATVGLAGRDGGRLGRLVDLCLTVPHGETARIQEVHAMLVHLLCAIIDDELYGAAAGGR